MLAGTHAGSPKLPRGRSRLPEGAVRSTQRERMLRAVVAAVATKGYGGTTVADIVAGACVSRQTFYDQFADKEDCFLAACDSGSELMFQRVVRAGESIAPGAGAEARLTAGIRAYLQFLFAEPEFARTFLLEVLAAGRSAAARRAAVHRRFAALTRTWHTRARAENPSWPAVPEEAYIAIVGAFHELVAERTREDRAHTLLELEDVILHLHLTLLAGEPPWR